MERNIITNKKYNVNTPNKHLVNPDPHQEAEVSGEADFFRSSTYRHLNLYDGVSCKTDDSVSYLPTSSPKSIFHTRQDVL